MRAPIATALFGLLVATLGTGCGALLMMSGVGASSIEFDSGELRSLEGTALTELGDACRRAIGTLGYDEIEMTNELENIRWRAQTAGGDLVEIHLTAKDRKRTELRIRIGDFGDEARSRLVLEQIRQSL